MCIRNRKLRIQFDRASIGMFGFAVCKPSRLQGYAETVPTDSILRIELNRTSSKRFRVGKPLRVVATGRGWTSTTLKAT